jgi:hypothetical protein
MAAPKKTETTEIVIPPLMRGHTTLRIIGTTPLFQNRMTAKVKMGLLCGSRKKTAAEKVAVKHHPIDEFRDSAEIVPGGPTALGLRVVALKAAMCTAAIETPGVTKSSAQRLLFMPGELVPLYGTPQLRMDVVRSADINRTPDIRSRAFLPKWGCEIEIQHILPQLPVASVYTLACNAGVLIGVGDYRQEKGKGSFGTFRVITPETEDEEWEELVANHDRAAQLRALDDPECADRDTEDLLAFYRQEVNRRAS